MSTGQSANQTPTTVSLPVISFSRPSRHLFGSKPPLLLSVPASSDTAFERAAWCKHWDATRLQSFNLLLADRNARARRRPTLEGVTIWQMMMRLMNPVHEHLSLSK